MDQRYARVATIFTANVDLSDWHCFFDKKPRAVGIPHHHCITIRIGGATARNPERRQRHLKSPRRTNKT